MHRIFLFDLDQTLLDFMPEDIPKEMIERIISAAMKAPTNDHMLHPENISHLNGFASIWCNIENLFLAATAEEYGCNLRIPLGNEAEHAREVLGYPAEYYMPCFIGIGRPKSDAAIPRQKDMDPRERIHWERS